MSKIEFEPDKFIVINRKRFDRFHGVNGRTGRDWQHPYLWKLCNAIENFAKLYKKETGKKMNQKYYVCNQDEPYADEVLKVILEGEKKKKH